MSTISEVVKEIERETERATTLHGNMNSLHRAVIEEEFELEVPVGL